MSKIKCTCSHNNANDLVTFYFKESSASQGMECNVRVAFNKDGIRSIEAVSNTQHEVLKFTNALDAISWLKEQGDE